MGMGMDIAAEQDADTDIYMNTSFWRLLRTTSKFKN
jgi:hypothetical protein